MGLWWHGWENSALCGYRLDIRHSWNVTQSLNGSQNVKYYKT